MVRQKLVDRQHLLNNRTSPTKLSFFTSPATTTIATTTTIVTQTLARRKEAMASSLISPELFSELQTKLEEESEVWKQLGQITETLEQQVAFAKGLLSRVHATPRSDYPAFLAEVEKVLSNEKDTIAKLKDLASKYPYYKYKGKWTHNVQDAIYTVLLTGWLGGLSHIPGQKLGHLLTLEDVGTFFTVEVNVKDRDVFHITIEEYLLAVTNITDELSRLATNSVTLGDYQLAVIISQFIKDLHNGFQILNLKNDILRRRVDTVKYHVKKVEDVVYDLSLRGLMPPSSSQVS